MLWILLQIGEYFSQRMLKKICYLSEWENLQLRGEKKGKGQKFCT